MDWTSSVIIVVTKTGSTYEVRPNEHTLIGMSVTRVSDSQVYDLESGSRDVTDDVNNYLTHEPITAFQDPPTVGECWIFWTRHGRLKTSPVMYVDYVHEEEVR